MTYLESYRELDSIEAIKRKAKDDAWVAMFMGNNPDRMKAIEDAMNIAIKEVSEFGAKLGKKQNDIDKGGDAE